MGKSQTYFAELCPCLGAVLSEASGKRAQVGDNTGRNEDITSQVVVCVLQVFRLL